MHRPLTVIDVVLVFMLLEVIKESIRIILWKKEQESYRTIPVTGSQLKDFLSKLEEELEEDLGDEDGEK